MATDVFYSASPFGTGNLLSGGSPTIVVDGSGNATVTLGGATQVDNIGIGVAVQYNSITSFIDSITTATSFHLVTALGANAASQTSTAVTSINHEYASWSALEAGFTDTSHLNTTDLVAGDFLVHACLYFDHDDSTVDSTALTISFGTSDATRYLESICPAGGTDSINSQRPEDGILDTAKYVLQLDTDSILVTISQIGTQLIGVQTDNTNAAGFSSGNIATFSSTTGIIVDKCIVKNESTAGNAIRIADASATATIKNTSIYKEGTQGTNSEGLLVSSGTVLLLNSTVNNFNDGIERDAGTLTVTNCAVFNNNDDFDGTMTIDSCASDDGDGTNSQTLDSSSNYANEFTDITTFDFSLVSGGVCEENGTDLSGSGVTDDIIGTSRPQGTNYDIGAFELLSGVTAAITGTATDTIDEDDITDGGKTIIITLTGDTWVAAGATFNAQRQAIINGLDAAASPTNGWNNEVRDNEVVTAVVRTSATVVTITLTTQAGYDITSTETITVTVPNAALVTSGSDITGSPTFTVAAAAAAGSLLLMNRSIANYGGIRQ